MLAEQGHRLVGKHAVRPPAVGDHSAPFRNLLEASLQLCDRHGLGRGDVSRAKFLLRPDIENDNIPFSKAGDQLFVRYRLKRLPIFQIGFNNSPHLSEPCFAKLTERQPKAQHLFVSQSVAGIKPFTANLDKLRTAKHLEVPRAVRNGHCRLSRKLLDGALPLSKQFQQFKPAPVGKRLADTRELLKELVFELPLQGRFHYSTIQPHT